MMVTTASVIIITLPVNKQFNDDMRMAMTFFFIIFIHYYITCVGAAVDGMMVINSFCVRMAIAFVHSLPLCCIITIAVVGIVECHTCDCHSCEQNLCVRQWQLMSCSMKRLQSQSSPPCTQVSFILMAFQLFSM